MPVSLILDTDMDTDCDDVGALAMLHALANRGQVDILGVICDAPTPWGAPCIQAINHYYGRPEIPVGTIPYDDLATNPRYDLYRECLKSWQNSIPYNQAIGSQFLKDRPHTSQVFDGVALYRKILAEQPDCSVVITVVGLLTVLAGLLNSIPDEYSPFNGMQLVQAKVKRLITMGVGSFSQGRDCFNWRMDKAAAGRVLNHWPTPLAVSEWGEAILTGSTLAAQTPPSNPVRRAYEIYLNGQGNSRCSWDQVAVLYSVLGAGEYFTEITGHRIQFSPDTGEHQWLPVFDGIEHISVQQQASDATLTDTIETLMTEAPAISDYIR